MKKPKRLLAALLTFIFGSSIVMSSVVLNKNTGSVKAKVLSGGDIMTVIENNVRVQVLSPTLVRIEEKGPKGFEDRNTFHIVNRADWDGDNVIKSETGNSVILTTSNVKIEIAKSAKTLSDVKIYDKQGKQLWKYTKLPSNKIYLPDLAEDVYVWEIADTPRIVPAEWGFAPQPDSNTEFRQTNGWDLTNDAPDMYIFLPNNDHKQLRKDFVRLTGRTEMVPLAVLGAWDSRYYPYSESTALAQIDGYHSRNLPLDVLVIDTDWRRATSGIGYDINTDLFPNMQGFLQKAHDKNVVIIFNDHPEPTQTGEVQNNVLAPDEINYRFTNLTRILNLGVDAWWYDRNWWTTIKPLDGFTHEVMGMAVYADAAKAAYPDRRLFMMSNIDGVSNGFNANPSNIAAHRYSVQWTGDTSGGQETILQELATTIDRGANSALPYVSTDLGAHNTKSVNITDAEYLRWVQMGALSPIFRPHVTSGDTGRMPWLRGEEVTNIYREYLNLRYRLLPVFYQLVHENYETGLPIVRSMLFDYREYAAANTSDQYMLGEDILIAPVIDTSKKVLPTEWVTTEDGQPGLKAEFFTNPNLSGSPALTKTVSCVDFNWGMGSPESGIGEDNFSIRFSGKFTPAEDVRLEAYTDDGCRLYVDGKLVINSWVPQEAKSIVSETVFKKGKTYNLVFEYFELTRDAVCRLGCVSADTISRRSVWIPEGEWIDTCTGRTVYGPQTITVECGIDRMPIFVKKGAVIPLADHMLTTSEKDWSHLTLDVYPSQRYSDTTILYEDDTVSNDYKNGLYRTTELSYRFDENKNAAVVKIAAAQGVFNGDRAFTNRNWTIRVHQPENWGELKTAKLANGTVLSFRKIEKDMDAMPFAISGGATDGAVYEIELSSNVYEAQTIYLQFDGVQDPPVPEADYDVPRTRSAEPKAVAVQRTINITPNMPERVNLSGEGTTDWVFTGVNGKLTRKSGVEPKIHVKYPTYINLMYDYRTRFSFTDGTNGLPVVDSQRGVYHNVLNDAFEWWVMSGSQTQQLNLYIGGWNGVGKLEIYDESGGKVDTYQFESSGGISFYRIVSINFRSNTPARLHIKYTLVNAYVQGGNITFPAATLKTIPEQPSIDKNITEEQAGTYVNLTDIGNADWMAVSKDAQNNLDRKANVRAQLSLTRKPQNVQLKEFRDLSSLITWWDGSVAAAQYLQGLATDTLNEYFEFTADSNKYTKSLILFISGSQVKGIIEVFDETENGNLIKHEIDFQGSPEIRRIKINYSSDWESKLHVRYKLDEKYNQNGYISFTAAALYQANELIINTGAYQPDTWTDKDVIIRLSSTNPPATDGYEVNINNTGWKRVEGDTIRVIEDGVYNFDFRIFNKGLGATADVKTLVVKKDSKAAELGIIVDEGSGSGRIFKPRLLPGSVSEVTIYYSVDGGSWKVLKDQLVDTNQIQGVVYRFKAVNQSGVESAVVAKTPDSEITLIGDTNYDGRITVADIIGIRRLIMEYDEYDADLFIRADVSEDDRLTVADIIATRAIILSQP